MDIFATTPGTYRAALAAARVVERIAGATSKPEEMPESACYFVTGDLLSGFGIDADGTLIGLFSTVKGRGTALLDHAEANGATALDCFDGFLPNLYGARGWSEYHRSANWTPGGPDVVFMRRAA